MESTKKPGGKITRLELMLSAWEDVMFLGEIRAKITKGYGTDKKYRTHFPEGMYGHNNWRSFRKYLLNSVASGARMNDFADDLYNSGPLGGRENPYTILTDRKKQVVIDGCLTLCGSLILYQWMIASRRVFNLSRDLQTLLAATALDDVKLRDLKFPFDSFVVELPEPILGITGNQYDMILFARSGTSPGDDGVVVLIPDRVMSYSPLSLTVKRELTQLAERKKWDALRHKIMGAQESVVVYHDMHTMTMWLSNLGDSPVLGHVENLEQYMRQTYGEREEHPHKKKAFKAWDDKVAQQQAVRILAGLCLYIRTLPPISKYRTKWQKAEVEPLVMPVQAITDEAEVCVVSTEFTLSPEERTIFSSREVNEELAGCMKKNPHFRRGFWKRPPGQGHNPDAEKSIWVRPTIVNRHLLREGELPLGAETILLPPKL